MKSVKNYPHELSLKSKFAKFFPAEPEKSKIREIKFPQKSPTTRFQERFCLSCKLSSFVSRFQQSRIREFRKFFGKKVTAPPPQLRKCPYANG